MRQQTLASRVEILERKVEGLEGLPDRVASLESQIVQFREDVRVEFSALRQEMRTHLDTLRDSLRAEIRAGDEATRNELRAEIRAGDEETRRHMRVLHEEVISRIALLNEHFNGQPSGRARTRRRGAKPRSTKH